MTAHRERLTAPPAWWVAVVAFAVVWGWIALVVGGWPAAVLTALPVALVVGGLLWRYGVVIDASADGLRAGRAHLPRQHIGAVEALNVAQTRDLLGPGADARAWLLVRPYIDTAIKVDVSDPDDPTPYWVIATRNPSAAAAALGAVPEPR